MAENHPLLRGLEVDWLGRYYLDLEGMVEDRGLVKSAVKYIDSRLVIRST